MEFLMGMGGPSRSELLLRSLVGSVVLCDVVEDCGPPPVVVVVVVGVVVVVTVGSCVLRLPLVLSDKLGKLGAVVALVPSSLPP